jgi:glycolate oxidase FAD binding subunit
VTAPAAAGPVAAFAAEVGPPEAGPVVAVGGRTQWDVGGTLDPGLEVREVRAPVGVVAVEAADMTVRVRAGTTVAELDDALAEVGQAVALPAWPGATVGGVLAVGRSGVRRLGWGPVRDTVLEVRYVSADGPVVKAGGPTVKNVSGFDLCRLLVGSLGTLGLLAEVVLRTRPLPATERWLAGDADPFDLIDRLHRPTSLLWDGTTTWVLLAGHPADVEAQARLTGLADTDGRPELPPHRWSLRPSALRSFTGGTAGGDAGTGSATAARFVAEVGVGIVHCDVPQPPRPTDAAVVALHERVKALFDPTGRLAPGRDPLATDAGSTAGLTGRER